MLWSAILLWSVHQAWCKRAWQQLAHIVHLLDSVACHLREYCLWVPQASRAPRDPSLEVATCNVTVCTVRTKHHCQTESRGIAGPMTGGAQAAVRGMNSSWMFCEALPMIDQPDGCSEQACVAGAVHPLPSSLHRLCGKYTKGGKTH